ncbi:porin [Shimia gijangensis]|uniref:Porin n=1 Tax=Shimia gijangensis TaxID=1470563 RepID=A0A1M6DAM5_9RHOB|nr:porin [Shimia gijangensis]SHI70215.1 porin [Shimia gijangensis]
MKWWSIIFLMLAILGLGASQGSAEPVTATIDKLIPLTDPTDDWRVRTTITGQRITMYGQISQAFLGYDDGQVGTTFFPVDNSNASTRVGFLWQLYPILGLDAVARFEGGITPRASNSMSQLDSSGSGFSFDGTHVRKLELILDNARFGTLSLGQGSTATDSVAEIDLSQTKVTAYSSVSQTAGGQYLRLADGNLSTLIIGDVFDNFDGDNVTGYNSDGSRKLRIRYDTPSFNGFKLSAAAGKDTVTNNPATHLDMALRYEGKFDAFRLSAGAGLSDHGARKVTSGSLSALHYGTGGNITVALGTENTSGDYIYVKLGLIREIFAAGDTAFSLDYYNGNDLSVAGSNSRSFGLAVSQQIKKKNIEVFGLIRRYEFDDPANSYKPSLAIFTGVRWKF